MNTVTRGFLYFCVVLFAAIGLSGLFVPDMLVAKFDLLPTTIKGTAEVRGLYGGGMFSWSLITLGALRCKSLSPGLLIALALIMGSIAAGRVVSLALDHEMAFSLPACIGETLIALASWTIYKHDKAARTAG